jgi:hypothetical protein
VSDIITQAAFTLVGVLLGTVFGFWFAGHRTRPNLRVSGGGSGLTGFPTAGISVSNPPRFTGIKIEESNIFGLRLHKTLAIGQSKHVDAADNCSARLLNKEKMEHICHLYWSAPENKVALRVTIPSGHNAYLLIFCRIVEEYPKYFIYQPMSELDKKPKIPVDQFKFDSSKDFIVEVTNSFGRTIYVDVGVHLELSTDKHLYFTHGSAKHGRGSCAF